MVDTKDLKSFEGKTSCRFESDLGHQIKNLIIRFFICTILGTRTNEGVGKHGFPVGGK